MLNRLAIRQTLDCAASWVALLFGSLLWTNGTAQAGALKIRQPESHLASRNAHSVGSHLVGALDARQIGREAHDWVTIMTMLLPGTSMSERWSMAFDIVARTRRIDAKHIREVWQEHCAKADSLPAIVERAEIALSQGDLEKALDLTVQTLADPASSMRTSCLFAEESRAMARAFAHRMQMELFWNHRGGGKFAFISLTKYCMHLEKSSNPVHQAFAYALPLFPMADNVDLRVKDRRIFETCKKRIALLHGVRAASDAHLALAALAVGLGHAQFDEDNEATSHFQEALRFSKAAFGEEHPIHAIMLQVMGRSCAAVGQRQEARSLLTDALNASCKAFGAKHLQHAMSQDATARVLIDLGDRHAAADLLEAAVAIYEDLPRLAIKRMHCLLALSGIEGQLHRINKLHQHMLQHVSAVEENADLLQLQGMEPGRWLGLRVLLTAFEFPIHGKTLIQGLEDASTSGIQSINQAVAVLAANEIKPMLKGTQDFNSVVALFREIAEANGCTGHESAGEEELFLLQLSGAMLLVTKRFAEAEFFLVQSVDAVMAFRQKHRKPHPREADIINHLRRYLLLNKLPENMVEARIHSLTTPANSKLPDEKSEKTKPAVVYPWLIEAV